MRIITTLNVLIDLVERVSEPIAIFGSYISTCSRINRPENTLMPRCAKFHVTPFAHQQTIGSEQCKWSGSCRQISSYVPPGLTVDPSLSNNSQLSLMGSS